MPHSFFSIVVDFMHKAKETLSCISKKHIWKGDSLKDVDKVTLGFSPTRGFFGKVAEPIVFFKLKDVV